MQLYEKNSVEDLILRGFQNGIVRKFNQSVSLADISRLRTGLSSYDRTVYIGAHICARFSQDYVMSVLRLYGDGSILKPALFKSLGIYDRLRESDVSTQLCFDYAGYGDLFRNTVAMRELAIKDRIKQTNIVRYGGTTPMASADVREKVESTVEKLYGVRNAFQSPVVKERIAQTNLRKRGVVNPAQSPDVLSKMHATMKAKYGHEYAVHCPELVEKTKRTVNERYGCDCYLETDEFRQKSRDTSIAKYGVDHWMKDPEMVAKVWDSKKSNGNACVSRPEHVLRDMLFSVFGEFDVECQYMSERYPFYCDFYVKSRDMYIELNAHWSHGHAWFPGTKEDRDALDGWRTKMIMVDVGGSPHPGYESAVHTFSVADVEKRRVAMANELNYVVFWSSDLSDAKLWFEHGCPDAQDWKYEYSWLYDREDS